MIPLNKAFYLSPKKVTYTKKLCMEAEIEGKKHFFMNSF
tara:strand:- start:881 stop:997 length:117 start_codon:yes stop_codon:yes gene_type:complete